jgi:hypothetical protein
MARGDGEAQMIGRIPGALLISAMALAIPLRPAPVVHAAGGQVRAVRLDQNPLITLGSSASLGDNINGPTIVRVPAWVERPLGRYYMYFAHHMGRFIRLAYADSISGPWTIYEPGVLPVDTTAMYRPQPDPPENLENFYTHVASPEIHLDPVRRKMVMWFHGWWTEGQQWPIGERAARDWARMNGYGQYTQAAESSDGIAFSVLPAITKTSYLRGFTHDGILYGLSRLGLLLRTTDPLVSFEAAASVFRGGPYDNRVRHVAVIQHAGLLYIFFTGIGDAPERIMMSTMSLAGDWKTWKAGDPVEVLRPEAAYECPGLPNAPSEAGDIKGPAQQLRDPGIFEEDGRTYLFYSFCGEQGIAAAELTWTDQR